jgi:hypothetical protein
VTGEPAGAVIRGDPKRLARTSRGSRELARREIPFVVSGGPRFTAGDPDRDTPAAAAFFGSRKKELIERQIYKSRNLAKAAITDYIETFHDRSRRHGHLGGVSPEQFEAAHKCPTQGVH